MRKESVTLSERIINSFHKESPRTVMKFKPCDILKKIVLLLLQCIFPGNVQTMKPVQNCTGFILCALSVCGCTSTPLSD